MKYRVIMVILYCSILGQVITELMDEEEVKEYLKKKKQEEEEALKNTQESDEEESKYETSTSTADSDDYEVSCKWSILKLNFNVTLHKFVYLSP